nr:MAG TPA: hypothetical protein [Bacteriophage sp.]
MNTLHFLNNCIIFRLILNIIGSYVQNNIENICY